MLTIGVTAYQQFIDLVEHFPEYVAQSTAALTALENTYFFQRFQESGMVSLGNMDISQTVLNALPGFKDSVSSVFTFFVNLLLVFALLPFILFYLLKDGDKLYQYIMERLPRKYKKEAAEILEETDQGLASFIKGQIIVTIAVGTMAYIGFLIIGIKHPLILALIIGLTNIIPYLGPIIGSVPALIVGMVTSTTMAGKVILLIIIIQQAEGLFIKPQIMGRTLYIHPLTIIVLLLVAGSLAGPFRPAVCHTHVYYP